MNIWIINGPNLNLLGKRNPEQYGTTTLAELIQNLHQKYDNSTTTIYDYQSNHEGFLIDKIHEIGFEEDTYAIINPGGLTHTSISLRDAIESVNIEFVEVHISDIHNRESYRKHSYIEDVVDRSIIGQGIKGYEIAVDYLLDKYSSSWITDSSTSE
jgi:3-dehydroquinate dehydratase-2